METTLGRPIPAGIGRVSQWFGENPADYADYKLAGHNGIDYAVPIGTPVLAAHGGRCAVAMDLVGYGIFVRITSVDDEMQTLYAHLSANFVSQGERVERGQIIGNSGNTGNSTGPHLHFGWQVTGVRNPAYRNWIDPVLGRLLGGNVRRGLTCTLPEDMI
ncbi:MAG: M23 family metallopeptidase [Pseudomonadota bacterium]